VGKLTGKRVLVTGGGQGLGAAIVEQLIDEGCDLAIHYHTSGAGAEELVAAATAVNLKSKSFQADLTDDGEVKTFVDSAAEFLGGIDILINNAGDLVARRKIEELDVEFWTKVMDINLTSMMLVTRQCVPHLSKNEASSIVNLASLAGRKGGHAGSISYSTAKGATLTWTRSLSSELAGRGIRVNAVAPGLTPPKNQPTKRSQAFRWAEPVCPKMLLVPLSFSRPNSMALSLAQRWTSTVAFTALDSLRSVFTYIQSVAHYRMIA